MLTRILITATGLAFLCAAISAQEPTRIGKHQIGETIRAWYEIEPTIRQPGENDSIALAPHRFGETFADWLGLNQMNLSDICAHKNDRKADYKTVCLNLSTIRDNGAGEFYIHDQYGRVSGWRFSSGKVTGYSLDGKWQGVATPTLAPRINDIKGEIVTVREGRAYTWKFSNGILSKVDITPDWATIYKQYSEEGILRHPEIVPTIQDEIAFLSQTYGQPSEIKQVPYSNAYGARWEREMVTWTQSDGTKIVAFERTEFNHPGQLELVVFLSKEALAESDQAKTNPYKQ